MSESIDFYFDFISPYAYIASTQIETLAARHGRTVAWRPVLLGVTVMRVMGLRPLMETPVKSDYLRHDAPRMAKIFNVPFRYHALTGINSLAACRAYLWLGARDALAAKRFAVRMFERLWVEGRDITPATAVAEEASALGLDAEALSAAASSDAGKQALHDAVAGAVARGVFGTPFFIADGEPIWGCDRLWMLDHWLQCKTWDGAGAKLLAR